MKIFIGIAISVLLMQQAFAESGPHYAYSAGATATPMMGLAFIFSVVTVLFFVVFWSVQFLKLVNSKTNDHHDIATKCIWAAAFFVVPPLAPVLYFSGRRARIPIRRIGARRPKCIAAVFPQFY